MMNNRHLWIFGGLLLLSGLLVPMTGFAEGERVEQEHQRHCIGLLWCTEQSTQGRSVDGLLWLYSAEEQGSYSRMAIRPFYSMEEDPTRDLLRRSFFWPLGTYERHADSTWTHVVPFYWHSEQPGHEWTFAAPLYLASTDGDVSWRHLFPLVSRQRISDYYARNYILGPVFISTSDTRRDLLEWDLLYPMIHHRSDRESSHTRVAPIYWSGEDRISGTFYRYLLPFHGSADSQTQHYHFVFPFYGSDVDTAKHTSRLTLLGLPPFKGAYRTPTLSLFESATSPAGSTHRFFPIYRYASDNDGSSTVDTLLLHRHQSSPSGSLDRLFPLYRYRRDAAAHTHEFDFAGHGVASWFRYDDSPVHTQHHLLGLYDYERGGDGSLFFSLAGRRRASLYLHRSQEELTEDRLLLVHDYFRHGDSSALSLLGVSEAALFRQESSPSVFRHRLFPLYRYSHDRISDETEYDALLLYRHLSTPTRVADRLLPMWDYTASRERDAWSLSLLGMDAAALYYHRRSEQATAAHLLPLYGLRTEGDGSSRLSILGLPPFAGAPAWALYERTSSPAMTSERLFPLYRRSHDVAEDATTINVAGWEPVSLFRYHATPTTSSHHLIPLYGYHREEGSTETSVLGLPGFSLYQASNTPLMLRHRLFPIYSYTKDHNQDERSLTVFWLFWHTTSPARSQTSLFPIASVASDQAGGWDLGILGLDPMIPVSWIRHSRGPDHARGFFAPFYDYQRDGDDSSLSIGGISAMAFYRNEHTSTEDLHRLFPFYRHHHDLLRDATSTSVLFFYQQERSPQHTSRTLLPLWQYEHRTDPESSRFNALGIGSLSLYEHDSGPSTTSDRLFPLYTYASNHETGQAELSVLWPLAQYQSQHGRLTSASLLWWLIAYNRPDEAHSNFHALGGSRMAMIRRVTSPEASILEFNPILPGFRYRSETGSGSSWDLFYGLVGSDSTGEKTRVTLFWVSL
ncbi:MAG: hypothetical protein NW202_12625 [Nitrospira sp.]|nr:hypothetical protein [Nitrospira sp.]